MSTRKVTIFFNADGKDITVETAARTLGELKQAVKDHDLSGKKIVDRDSRHTYEVDDAQLPAGDFIIYVYPKKSKAGGKEAAIPAKFKKMSPDKLHTYPHQSLQQFGTFLKKTYKADIDLKKSKEEVQKLIRKWMIRNNWPEAVATASPGKASKGSEKLEKTLKEKLDTTKKAAPAVQVDVNINQPASGSASGRKVKAGIATLESIDAKLDIVLENIGAISAKRLSVGPVESKRDLENDAERLKRQFGDVQG